jgi:hypothetical protein
MSSLFGEKSTNSVVLSYDMRARTLILTLILTHNTLINSFRAFTNTVVRMIMQDNTPRSLFAEILIGDL